MVLALWFRVVGFRGQLHESSGVNGGVLVGSLGVFSLYLFSVRRATSGAGP